MPLVWCAGQAARGEAQAATEVLAAASAPLAAPRFWEVACGAPLYRGVAGGSLPGCTPEPPGLPCQRVAVDGFASDAEVRASLSDYNNGEVRWCGADERAARRSRRSSRLRRA
jgi:hypothetical protein